MGALTSVSEPHRWQEETPGGVWTPPGLENVWALCGLYSKTDRGKWDKEGMEGVPCLSGPPCWMCFRDQAWTGAADTWGVSGFPVELRSPGQGCGPSSERGKPRGLLQHIPLPRHTHTPLFAPPCCSQPTVQRCGATQDLNRKPKGCSLCCSIPLHGTWIFGSQRTLASGEACPGRWLCPHTQPHSGCTWSYLPGFKPGPPRQSWEHFLTSPPVPVLSPALRMFWPGS